MRGGMLVNFHAGSNTTRIPISLKFELNEDFYENFISPLRQERRLSDMIINLLRAYYEDTEIRRLVDCRILGQEEIDALNREIERISLEHSKSIMKTSALKFETDSYFDNEIDFAQEQAETPVATMESLLRMVNGLSQEVKQVKSVLNMDTNIRDADFDVPDFEAEVAQEVNSNKNYFNNTASAEDAAIYDDDDTPIIEEPTFTALRPENVKPDTSTAAVASDPVHTAVAPEPVPEPVKPVELEAEPVAPKRRVPNSFKMLSKTLEG
jgi:hypothetical protein